MEEDPDESDELVVEPNPIILDQLIDDNILYSSNITMDEDFNFLLAFVPVLFQTMEGSSEKYLCENWLDRLIGLPSHSTTEKRERNIYLVNLLLNIGRGQLSQPFDKPPPQTLQPGMLVFGGSIQPGVCYRNMNLEVEDFAEYSRDSRTFFASKALPDGNGAFGYLAVSLGGGDAMWLDCQGNNMNAGHNDILNRFWNATVGINGLLEVTELGTEASMLYDKIQQSVVQEDPIGNKSWMDDREPPPTSCWKPHLLQFLSRMFANLKNLISKRSPQKDRSELLPYYYGLMQRIREITTSVEIGCEIFDPLIEKMIEDLQMDIVSEGKVEISEIACTNKKSWLCALEKKIERLLETTEQRELTLNQLEKMLVEHEKDEINFLDVSNAIKPPKLDPILAEAVRDRPSEYNVTMLGRHYQEDIVCTFLKLLETAKMHVVNQERMAYDDFVMCIRAEVLNEARSGIERYNVARKELQLVTKVMRKVEEIKTRLLKDVERTTNTTGDPNQLEKEHMIDSEIEDAKARLEESQAQSDKIEAKIAKLHDQIHQFTSEYHKMAEEGKRELDFNLKDISDLQSQVASQERKLLMLKHKLDVNIQAISCEDQNPCSN